MKKLLLVLLITVSTACLGRVPPTMTNTDIEASLERLEAFTSVEHQKQLYRRKHQHLNRKKSNPEELSREQFLQELQVTRQLNWELHHIRDNQYLVEVAFLHEQGFPKLRGGMLERIEQGEWPAYDPDVKNKIFETFLGQDFYEYSPKLLVVAKVVRIEILVDSAADLANVVRGQKVYSLKHGGDPIPVEQEATR